MKKFFLDSYVVSIDDESKLSDIIDFLKEVKLRAYNYKVIFSNNKISVRFIIMPNLILSLEGLSLYKAKEIVNKSEIGNYSIPTNVYITFHNTPIKGEFLEKVKTIVSKFNYYYIKIDLFPQDELEVRIGKFRYVEDSSLQVLASLSDEVLQKLINLECYAGFLTFVDDIFAEILLKCYGVRNLKIIEKIIKSKNYKIKEGQTKGDNAELIITFTEKIIHITKDGYYVNNNKISKGELYRLFSS